MFKGLDDEKEKAKKKTIKPLVKFAFKDVKALKKKEVPKKVPAVRFRSRPISSPASLSISAESRVTEFCNFVQASELEKDRLIDYVTKLDPRGANSVELNAWSTSQLAVSNIVRTEPIVSEQRGRKKTITIPSSSSATAAEERSTLFWILTIMLDTERMKKFGALKKKDAVSLSIPDLPQELSQKRLMSEYVIFKLWLIVRYVFTTALSAVIDNPNVMVPIFIVKADGRSALGRIIKEQMRSSFRKEVQELQKPYRCTFIW